MKGAFFYGLSIAVIGWINLPEGVVRAGDTGKNDVIQVGKKPYPDLETPVAATAIPLTTGAANSFACTGAYPKNNVTCLAKLAPSQFPNGATNGNDVWGYVSPSGREYAIVGLDRGTGFVEVTNPTSPVILANIIDDTSIWSDVEGYLQYIYNANESGSAMPGIQIFDLGSIDTGVVSLVNTFSTGSLRTSHTLTINPVTGFLYTNGSNLNNGRLTAYNLANPVVPVLAGRMADATYVHDSFVISYTSGPAAGKEIAYCFCGGTGLKVVDVTVKSNAMPTLATRTYPTLGYCHQGWLTEDRKHLLIDDEGDGLARTYVFDVQTPSNPVYIGYFPHTNNAGDHNLYIKDHFVFESNYTGGVRIFDVTTVGSVTLTGSVAMPEVGYHDTYIPTDAMTGGGPGTWSNYPYLPSGVLLVSNYLTSDAALFILDPSAALGLSCQTNANCADLDPCTEDVCVSLACQHNAKPAGTACNDNDQCTVNDLCQGTANSCTGTDIDTIACTSSANCFGENCNLGTGFCECNPCPVVGAVVWDGVKKNRHLSINAGNPGLQTALRVTLADLPDSFNGFQGTQRWVALPNVNNISRLSCSPSVADWSVFGTVHISDRDIVPGASYVVEAISSQCDFGNENLYSAPQTIPTPRWADLVGIFTAGAYTQPNNVVDFVDIGASVDRFRNIPAAPPIEWTDLNGDQTDHVQDFLDIGSVVDSFRGLPYPFGGPPGCQ